MPDYHAQDGSVEPRPSPVLDTPLQAWIRQQGQLRSSRQQEAADAARVEIITDELADRNPDALTADGFDAALIGYTVNSCEPTRAIYSVARCLEVLQASGMTADEAEEYFWFNTAGAYVGVNGPLFVELPEEEMC